MSTKQQVSHKEQIAPFSYVKLIVCVLGIYGSFLTWALLQEKVTTTKYGDDGVLFRASHVLNIVQSVLACIAGYGFISYNRSKGDKRAMQAFFPNKQVFKKYLLVAGCQSLSSPFAYASLKYVDYLTMLLAKSCKLVPVMIVGALVYRRTYPFYKYVVVGLITAGVSLFSVGNMRSKTNQAREGQAYGLALLGVNLFLDGLYNTTQDEMFRTFKMITGQHMMVVMNLLTAIITTGLFIVSSQPSELVWFLRHHPIVMRDVFLFGLCGAIGQLFIFVTLAEFGSLTLVSTTVTRKMASMLLSVVLFNHKLITAQWVGVFMVFGGIIAEAVLKR